MNDPHVVSLRYHVRTNDGVTYEDPTPVTFATAYAEMTLADSVLTATMLGHHPTVGSAMDQLRPVLRAWEIQTALNMGPGCLTFDFVGAEVIDRNPPPPGTPVVVHGTMSGVIRAISGAAKCEITKREYPGPPARFHASPFVEFLWARYEQYRDGKDLLTTMGYVCLTAIECEAGDRDKAAKRYNISKSFLGKFGNLAATTGDSKNVRKVTRPINDQAHVQAEMTWIDSAAKIIIRRVAEHDSDPTASATLPQITLADLPSP